MAQQVRCASRNLANQFGDKKVAILRFAGSKQLSRLVTVTTGSAVIRCRPVWAQHAGPLAFQNTRQTVHNECVRPGHNAVMLPVTLLSCQRAAQLAIHQISKLHQVIILNSQLTRVLVAANSRSCLRFFGTEHVQAIQHAHPVNFELNLIIK